MPSALAATDQWPCRWRSAPFQFPKSSYFKILQGSVATLFRWSWKILSYFVSNLSKTLHINFYQNRSSIIEVMIKKFWCVFLCLTVYFCIWCVMTERQSSSSFPHVIKCIISLHKSVSGAFHYFLMLRKGEFVLGFSAWRRVNIPSCKCHKLTCDELQKWTDIDYSKCNVN